MGKKGVSPIIATVLIILLTISAGVMISKILVPFVKNNLYESTECLGFEDYFQFEEIQGSNCISNENILVSIRSKSVEREVAGNNANQLNKSISGFSLVFVKSGKTERLDVPGNKIKMYNYDDPVSIPEPGGVRTYNASVAEKFDDAEVYPVLASGRICDKSDSIKLLNCGK